jgi:uncharacterized membrane protein YhaH (DUF805 family)
MSFTEAIRDGFSKYATFTGRSSRPAYWWFWLFGVLVTLVAEGIDLALSTDFLLSGIVSLALLLPTLAVAVRRLRDAGHSTWWLLIVFVPVIGAIVLIVFLVQPSKPQDDTGADTLAAPAI